MKARRYMAALIVVTISAAADPARHVPWRAHVGAVAAPEGVAWGSPALRAAARYRPVAPAPDIATAEAVAVGDALLVDLFESQTVTAVVDRVATNVIGTVSLRGRIAGSTLGYFLMSSHDATSLGSVTVPEQGLRFALQYEPAAGVHYLLDHSGVDRDERLPAPPVLPPSEPVEADHDAALAEASADLSASDPEAAALGVDEPALIDVLVVYTPAAREWADSSGGGLAQIIAQAMERAQLAHDNSQTRITKRLAHAAEVSYVESGASLTDLERLRDPADGYMDSVHTWRDLYGADLVALLTRTDDAGGIAYLLTDKNGLASHAFSLSRVQQVSWTYTHIHEMGHNMGLHHHKLQNEEPGPTNWKNWRPNTWSAGWRWVGANEGRYCSIMTYADGKYFSDGLSHDRVAYFSDPNLSHQGAPIGDAADGDNARTLREIKHTIAAYRTAQPTAPTGVAATDGAYADRVHITWERVPGATHYRVSRATSAAGAKTDLGAWQTGAAFDDTSAQPRTTYFYFVRAAIDEQGANASAYSAYATGRLNDTFTLLYLAHR